jgi:hypothetical protein
MWLQAAKFFHIDETFYLSVAKLRKKNDVAKESLRN